LFRHRKPTDASGTLGERDGPPLEKTRGHRNAVLLRLESPGSRSFARPDRSFGPSCVDSLLFLIA
jgi:hypothetical protein